jgi:hypothetical protein
MKRRYLLPAFILCAALGVFISSQPAAVKASVKTARQIPAKSTVQKSQPQQESLESTNQISQDAKLSIGQQIRAAEYWFTPSQNNSIAAGNRGQRMSVQFDQNGLTLSPWKKEGEATWSFQIPAAATAAPTAEKAKALYGRNEWFENSEKGIEHGMTLEKPTADMSQPLVIHFPVKTELHGQLGNANQLLFKDAAGDTQLRYEQLYATDADGKNVPTSLAWNDQKQEIQWTISHQGHSYPLTIDPLITRAAGKVVASDGAAFDNFGESIALSGDTLAVGCPRDDIGVDVDKGSIYIFTRNQGGANNWGEVRKITASDSADGDSFGRSVSLSGDNLAVGATGGDFGVNINQGSVYVFSRNQGGANNWGEVRKFTSSDGGAFDFFGYSISLSGDTLAVGAYSDDIGANSEQGSTYIFSRNQGGTNNWGEVKKLTASDGTVGDYFGRSISLSGDNLAVGADSDNVGANPQQGSAYIFSRNQGGANNWGEVKKLTTSDGTAGDQFGYSVSLSGETLSVGARNDYIGPNVLQGSAYVFSRNQGGTNNWGEVKKLTASDGAEADYFGWSVSLSGDSLAVGAYADGSAYIFSRNQGGANNWGEVKKLTASDGTAGDQFGYSVSLSGETLAVGSYFDDIGANTEQGSVTLFDMTQSQWTKVDAISPPTISAITAEKFGTVLAATSDTLVVGAPDSDVVVLGGGNVGRAYVFNASTSGTVDPRWTLQMVLQPSFVESNSRFGASVAIIPGFIAVGASGDDSDRGQAHLFAINQGGIGNWGEVKRLQGNATGYRFGAAVALSAEGWWAVGSPDAGAGQVALYERNTGGAENWGIVTAINYTSPFSPTSPEAGEFGASLALDGTRLLVGAPGGTGQEPGFPGPIARPNAGFAFLYEKDQGGVNSWGQLELFREGVGMTTGFSNGRFGAKVALNGDWVAATQPGQGNALLYHREILIGAISPAPWGLAQRFIDVQSIALSENILAISKNSQATVETFRRDPAQSFAWKSQSLVRENAVPLNTGYGKSITLAGESLFIGAPNANSGQGQVHISARQQQDFQEITKRLASDGGASDGLGVSVSLSGDTLAVGASGNDSSRGSVYLLSRNQGGANNWGEVKKLTASDGALGDSFGRSVSLSGDTLAVGAAFDDIGANTNQGSAYVFIRNQGGTNSWGEIKKLTVIDGAGNDQFGYSISLFSDSLAVGAKGDQIGANANQGSAYLFSRNQGGVNNWGEVRKLTASDGAAFEQFSNSISLSGDSLAVGAESDQIGANTNQGSAYLFSRNQGGVNNWGEVKKLTASDGAVFDSFGTSLSLSGDSLAVGALGDTIDANFVQGSVYLFSRNQGGVNNWGLVKKITASDGAVNSNFGSSASLSGDSLAVGALVHDVGTNTNQGSAYIFSRNQGGANNWGEVKNLTASDGAAGDLFGTSVSLSGDSLAVGVFSDDSGANANQGSVYIFQIDRSLFDTWKLEKFGSISLSNPGLEASVWGDLADPDGDGLKNLAEAYYGLNPLVADTPSPSTAVTENNLFTYRWQRAASYQGIQAIPYWSPDLVTWYRSGSGPVGNIRTIGMSNRGSLLSRDHDTLEATMSTTSTAKGFMRLEFSR